MRARVTAARISILHTLLLIQLLLLSIVNAQCLYPNGTANPDPYFQPCSPDSSNPLHTICCAIGRPGEVGGVGETRDICLSNGLCMNSVRATANSQVTTGYFRDACTVRDWGSGKCLNVCTDNVNTANMQLTPCDGSQTSEKWCCGSNKDCCTNNPIIIAKSFGVDDKVTTSSSAIPISKPTSSPTIKPSSTQSRSSMSGSSTAKPKSSNSKKSSSLSGGAIAGIVIAALIGLVLVFSAGFYIAKRRQSDPTPNLLDSREVEQFGHNDIPQVHHASPVINYELHGTPKPQELP